jgi:secretion/DNA translocation related TadE-like protein
VLRPRRSLCLRLGCPARWTGRCQVLRPESGDHQRGSGSVLVIGVVAVIVTVGLASVHLAGAVANRHAAQATADAAALAGAFHAGRGEAGCSAAAQVAVANGAVLTSCSQEGREVWVSVEVRAGGVLPPASGRARAGPVPQPVG